MNVSRGTRFIIGLTLFALISLGFYNYLELENERRLLAVAFIQNIGDTTNSNLSSPMITWDGESVWPLEDNEANDRITIQDNFTRSMNMSGRFKTSNPKIIFLVPHVNYDAPPPTGNQLFISKKCPVNACSLTMDRADLKEADAVFFETLKRRNILNFFSDNVLLKFLPKPSRQLWIFFQAESPPVSSKLSMFSTRYLNNFINWTITYRRDSTIPHPYGKFETFPNYTRIENHPIPKGTNYASGRTKKVGWFVSNCNLGTYSGRYDYAMELSKYIDVDIYGGCGRLKCPKNKYGECQELLRRDYKFYLSFENNCCKDYITEKLFTNALRNDILPVVLGAAPEDYKAMAPPGSYIHVDDFESPKALADYLHLLDKNDTLYNEYFRWKTTGTFISTDPWCRLCALLHANDNATYVHWYRDFHTWWEGACLERAPRGQWQSWRQRNYSDT